MRNYTVYCAAKAGLHMLTRSLAKELGPEVRVNGISPGPIAGTEGMARLAPDPGARQKHFDRIALKRWGEIGEVADAALWLCSDAARYVTGTIIDVDGGSQVGDASRVSLERGLA